MAEELQALNQLVQELWNELDLPDNSFNLHERLGISPDAEPDEIKRAYREKMLKEYAEKFDSVHCAYEILKHGSQRTKRLKRRISGVDPLILLQPIFSFSSFSSPPEI